MMELFGLAGGTVLGLAAKYVNVASQRNADIVKTLAGKSEIQNESFNKATERVPVGSRVRQFLTLSLVVAVIGLPALYGLLEAPVIVMTEEKRGFFSRIFNGEMRTVFHEVNGLFLHKHLFTCFTSIIGFYFGQAIIRK